MLQIRIAQYKTGFILLILFLTLTSACSTEMPAVIPVIPLESTPKPVTETPEPSPMQDAASTTTPAAVPTGTTAPVDGIDYSDVEISFGGFLPNWQYFITFEFPEPVSGNYHAVVDKNKPYTCEVLNDYPQRLYCNGPLVAINNWASVELYASNGASEAEPILSGRFFVPLME